MAQKSQAVVAKHAGRSTHRWKAIRKQFRAQAHPCSALRPTHRLRHHGRVCRRHIRARPCLPREGLP